LQDEAQTIATFATNHAIAHVTILAEDSETSKQMVEAFQSVWQALGYEAKLITLPKEIQSGDQSLKTADLGLLDLKMTIANQGADMLLLAMSGEKARLARPYLDISTPTLAFSSTNDADYNNLNAVRVVDIPFLLDKDNSQFTYYQTQAAEIHNTELRRWFALGVDALQILLANSRVPDSEMVINGLTGKLMIDKTGHISRRLPIGRFTYNGLVLEN
nr:penicillin-binding protein activator [Methylotenera sp.]